VIVDDVITAGTAIRESVELIRHAGAEPVAVLLAVDRQERGRGARSAVQEVEAEFGLRCVSLITLAELIDLLSHPAGDQFRISEEQLGQLREYREKYGTE
jgi:orotate phosphoribosyltransferase